MDCVVVSIGTETEGNELEELEKESLSQIRLLMLLPLLLLVQRPARLKSAQDPTQSVHDLFVLSVVALEQSPMSSRLSTALPELVHVSIGVPPPFVVSPFLA